MYKISIYINEDDKGWIKELKKYAKDKRWSMSLTIREIISSYFKNSNNQVIEANKKTREHILQYNSEAKIKLEDEKENKILDNNKIDIATFEAQMENKIKPKNDATNIVEAVDNCNRRIKNRDGTHSCWFFDQGRSYYSYCIQHCWTREDLWGARVRK